MNKILKPFFVLAIALFSLSGFTQDRLIRVDSASIAWRQKDLTLSLYDKELARLLVPKNTQFGVIRVPYFHSESSLTYDSVNHTLVYINAWRNIYEATSMATTKRKKVGNKVRLVPRKHIYNYAAPEVGTYTLNITDEQAQKLKEVWTNAIQNAEAKEENIIFDDPTWEFFIGNKRAKSYQLQNTLVKLANELMDSVFNGNWLRKEARKMNCQLHGNRFHSRRLRATIRAAQRPQPTPFPRYAAVGQTTCGRSRHSPHPLHICHRQHLCRCANLQAST